MKNRNISLNPSISDTFGEGYKEEDRRHGYIDSGYPHTLISTGELSAYNNNLVGKVLTIIDATGLDKDSKKAVKDLIKQAVYDQYDRVHHWMQFDKDKKPFPFDFVYDIRPSNGIV